MDRQIAKTQAHVELVILDSKAGGIEPEYIAARLMDRGIEAKVFTDFLDLKGENRMCEANVVRIGRVLQMLMLEFVDSHPDENTTTLLKAALAALSDISPLLGPILAGLTTSVESTEYQSSQPPG